MLKKQKNKTINKINRVSSVYGTGTLPQGSVLYKSCNFLCWRTSTKRTNCKPFTGAQQKLMQVHVKEDTSNIRQLLLVLTVAVFTITSPSHFLVWVHISIQVCILLYKLYITAYNGRLQWNGDDRRGCVRVAHVIACCRGSPSPWWMTCGGVGPQLFTMTWEVTSLGETEQPLRGSKMLMRAQGQQVHPSCPVLKWSLSEQLWARTVTHCTDKVYISAALLPGFSCTSF